MYSSVFIITQETLINSTWGQIWPHCRLEEDDDEDSTHLSMIEFEA